MSIKKIILPNGDIRWEVRAHINGRGSQILRRRFDKKIEAEEFSGEILRERRSLNLGLAPTILNDATFATEAEHWLKESKHRTTEGSRQRAEGIVKQVLPQLGSLPVSAINQQRLTTLQAQFLDKGYAHSTVNRILAVILAILNNSVRAKRIAFNPAQGFRMLRLSQSEMMYWKPEEARSFLQFCDRKYPKGSADRWIYVVYLLALNTGMRAGEIWGLKVGDLSPATQSIMVQRQFNKITAKFGSTKGKRSRAVPCNRELLAELEQVQKSGPKREFESTVFMNETGKPICHSNFLRRVFFVDQREWGGRKIRFHDLRHTAVTLMISANVDLRTVKEICGHRDISTTMNYAHVLPGSIARVANMFQVSPNEEREVKKSE